MTPITLRRDPTTAAGLVWRDKLNWRWKARLPIPGLYKFTIFSSAGLLRISYAEALSYFPKGGEFHVGPAGYLNHIRQAKDAVSIPIIASLNCASVGGWREYARQVEQAGADAIECNIYSIPTDPGASSSEVEQGYLDIFRAVKHAVKIPVAIIISSARSLPT